MKKLSFVVAMLLLTTQTWAKVHITVVPNGKTATIKYATDGEKVRAFALDITVDKGTIQGISGFMRRREHEGQPRLWHLPGQLRPLHHGQRHDRGGLQVGRQ